MWRQQLDRDLPILQAKSEANRQNLAVRLKRVPRGVQTLNDLRFITAPSGEEPEVDVRPAKRLSARVHSPPLGPLSAPA